MAACCQIGVKTEADLSGAAITPFSRNHSSRLETPGRASLRRSETKGERDDGEGDATLTDGHSRRHRGTAIFARLGLLTFAHFLPRPLYFCFGTCTAVRHTFPLHGHFEF